MILSAKANEILDSWFNGNREEVRQKLKNKSKCYALDLVSALVELHGIKHSEALSEVYKMCEVL